MTETLLTPPVHSLLHLRFYQGWNGETALQVIKQTPPLRVVRAFHLPDGAAFAHLHNLSGGILGGDSFEVDISVEANAQAQLTTPGATRIYRYRSGLPDASLHTRIEVEAGGVLEYLPDPTIPFADARYRQSTQIRLGPDAGLFWWETLSPGREARGERFRYQSMEMSLGICTDHHPIALERYQLCPEDRPLSSLVRLGGYLYHTTFYICRVGVSDATWRELEDELTSIALQHTHPGNALWGVSTLPSDGIVIRGVSMTHRSLSLQLVDFWRAAKLKLYARDVRLPRKNY